jgi:hypothetical protein
MHWRISELSEPIYTPKPYKPYVPAETFEGKPCVKCGRTTRYAKDKRCVFCWRKRHNEYMRTKRANGIYVKPKSRNHDHEREKQLMYRHGLTTAEVEHMRFCQGNRCAICGDVFADATGRYKKRLAYVDHSHKTGHIRGLLCPACNKGLGFFRDNPDILRNAITYLETS